MLHILLMKPYISSVKVGRAFEELVLKSLSVNKFTLYRMGSAGDKGIDLIGHWQLHERRVNVIVQCKNENKKVNPTVIRDLISCTKQGEIGILATSQPFSKGFFERIKISLGTIQAMHSSSIALILTQINELDGNMQSFVANQKTFELLPRLSIARDLHSNTVSIQYNNADL